MGNNEIDTNILKEKILKGIEKAIERLIKSKQQVDGEIVISRNGNIEKIKAREI